MVSVVSAMAEMDGRKVSLGTQLEGPLAELLPMLDENSATPQPRRMFTTGDRRDTGAKFAKP